MIQAAPLCCKGSVPSGNGQGRGTQGDCSCRAKTQLCSGDNLRASPKPRNKDEVRSLSAYEIRNLGVSRTFVNASVHLLPSGTRTKLTVTHSAGEVCLVCIITDTSYSNILTALKSCN